MSLKAILVASDLSERSDRAVARALLLASETGARVTLVSIIDDSLPDTIAATLRTEAATHLGAQVAAYPDVAVDLMIEIGDPLKRLSEIVTRTDHDLVVVGCHRKRKFLDGWRLTTVERLVSAARVPVLMAVTDSPSAYRKVLVPVAFSLACSRAVALGMEIARGAEMRLVHSWHVPFVGMTGVDAEDMSKAVENEVTVQTRVWSATLPEGAPKVVLVKGGVMSTFEAERHAFKPDLVAIGAHTRAVSMAGIGSFASELIREPFTDLLITRSSV